MPLSLMILLDRSVLHGQLRGTLPLMRMIQKHGERGDPDHANRLLGAPTTTLTDWLGSAPLGDRGNHAA